MQAQLNSSNTRLADLRRRYGRTTQAVRNSEKRAKSYETYLSRNCRSSKQIAKIALQQLGSGTDLPNHNQ